MSNAIPLHKKLAMGQPTGYKSGGIVRTPVGAGAMVPKPSGSMRNPLTTAKMNNGVPGMKKGGSCK